MIEDIQKLRFLNNLYKSAYAYGDKIDQETIKTLYSRYFRINPLGTPIDINAENLRAISKTNVDAINYMMATTIFNFDVLYDAVNDSVDNLYETITSLNKRIDGLRSKRAELESKIDDLIFGISNSDGFYASFTEQFTGSLSMDMSLSSAYLDLDSRSVEIPSISSRDRTKMSGNYIEFAEVTYSSFYNGTVLEVDKSIGEKSNFLFDGLTDTNWTYRYGVRSPGLVSLQLKILPRSPAAVSRIYVRLSSERPVKVMAQINGGEPFIGQAEKDHDNFVFNFPSQQANSILLFFIKNTPDSNDRSQAFTNYMYDFTIRDIIISGEYKDFSGVYVSNPIFLNSADNSKNIIDAVMLDAETQNLSNGNSIDFYLAKNVPLATSINDFNWIPISPSSLKTPGYSSVVNFNTTNLGYKTIVETSSTSDSNEVIKKYLETSNANLPGYEGKEIYQVAKLDASTDYREPAILEGFGKIKWYKAPYLQGASLDLKRWISDLIPNANINGLISSEQTYNSSSVFWKAPQINDRRKCFDNI